MSAPARLHPDDLAALAELVSERVVARLRSADATTNGTSGPPWPVGGRESERERPVLLTAQEVARRFGVSAEWVRDHRDELGVVRLGDGPRPRLRFDAEIVVEALTRRSTCKGSETEKAQTRAAGRRTTPPRERAAAPGLLPVFTLDSPQYEKSGPGVVAATRDQATRNEPSPRPEPTRAMRSGSGGAGRAPRAATERSQHGA